MTSSAPDPCSAVSDDLGWGLGTLYRALLKTANATASDVPGGQRGYHVLTAVAGGGLGTQLALAHQLGVDRTVMTYLLDDLEKAELIARRPDPADRRARRVVITEAGQTLLVTLHERMARVSEHVLAGLPAEERTAFRRSLQRAAESLSTVDPTPGACAVAEEITAATAGSVTPATEPAS